MSLNTSIWSRDEDWNYLMNNSYGCCCTFRKCVSSVSLPGAVKPGSPVGLGPVGVEEGFVELGSLG